MGAADFATVIVTKDLRAAFDATVRSAQHEYGHGGYTGTIAEKSGYVLVGKLPARMTIRRLQELVWQYEEWQADVADVKDGWTKGPAPKNPVPENWQGFVAKVHGAGFDDKWGPAAAVEITGKQATDIKRKRGRSGTTDKVYVLMGMAPE